MDQNLPESRRSFAFGDVCAVAEFSTSTSCSYRLERHSESLCPIRYVGWLDLHFPCHGHIRARLRIHLPEDDVAKLANHPTVEAILDGLRVPLDESWEADFIAGGRVVSLSQAVNREGITDRM